MSKKWVIISAIVLGGLGGSLATANLIDALKPYSVLIVSGSTFISAVISFFVAKANKE